MQGCAPSTSRRVEPWEISGASTLALSVPSAIVPQERNLVINPLHPLASRIRVLSQESFWFDPRMYSA